MKRLKNVLSMILATTLLGSSIPVNAMEIKEPISYDQEEQPSSIILKNDKLDTNLDVDEDNEENEAVPVLPDNDVVKEQEDNISESQSVFIAGEQETEVTADTSLDTDLQKDLIYTTLNASTDEYDVSVSGKMPKDASLIVSSLYNDLNTAGIIDDTLTVSPVVLDICIASEDEIYHPVDYNENLLVSFSNATIPSDVPVYVYDVTDTTDIKLIADSLKDITYVDSASYLIAYEDAKQVELFDTTLEKITNGYIISATGNMPENASLSVTEVYNYDELEEKIGEENYKINVAFDINILVDGEIWQPADFDELVKITISNYELEDAVPEDVQVYRIVDEEDLTDEDGFSTGVEEVTRLDCDVTYDGEVIVETDHFTIYTIGTIITDADTERDAYLCYGWQFAWQLKKLANPSQTDAAGADNTITDILWVDTPFTSDCRLTYYGYGNGGTQTAEIYARLNGTTVELYTSAQRVYLNNINSAGMFQNFRALQHVDLSKFDATSATNLAEMFMYDMNLQSVDFSQGHWNTSNVTSMQDMFHCCYSLESINFGDHFDTSNVTAMGWMFYNCRSLKNLSLGDKFDTSNVINARSMFESTWNLESFNFGNSNFCMSKATSLNKMFFEAGYYSYDGDNKLSLTLPDAFNASSATDMSEMFRDAKFLSLNLGANFNAEKAISINTMFNHTVVAHLNLGDNFNAASATDLSAMFSNTSGPADIQDLNLGTNFNGSAATNMRDMFSGLHVNTLRLGEGFYTGSCLNMSGMFYGARIDINEFELGEHFDTSHVTSMRSMFGDMSVTGAQFSIDLGTLFDTSNVTDFHYMFGGNSNIRTVDLGDKFYTANATDMSRMFYGCLHLKSIDWGEHIDTSKVTTFSNLFESCQNLTVLDLSQFTFSSNLVADGAAIFNNTSSLRKIYAPKTIAAGKGSSLFALEGTSWYLDMNEDGIADSTTSYNEFISGITNDSKVYILGAQIGATTKLCDGKMFAALIKQLVDPAAFYNSTNNTITDVRFVDTPFYSTVNVSAGSSYAPIYAEYNTEDHTIDLYTLPDTVYANEDCQYMFCMLTALSDCSMLSDILFDNTTDMSYMFANAGLSDLDLSGRSFPACTTAERMILSSVVNLDLSETQFPVLNNIGAMFLGATKLKTINMHNMSATADASSASQLAFTNCTGLEDVDMSGVELPKVSSLANMLRGTFNLKNVNMDGAVFAGATSLNLMFSNTGTYGTGVSISMKGASFPSVTNVENMFLNCNAASVVMDNCQFDSLETAQNMFYRIGNANLATSVSMKNLNAPLLSDAILMFQNATLSSIILSGWNTPELIDASQMFKNVTISYLDLGDFDTSTIITLSAMFSGCTATTLVLDDKFDTSSATNMASMFESMSNLTNITFGDKFDTSSVYNMDNMFASCGTAELELDLRSFDTSSVTTMAGMFNRCKASSMNLTSFNVEKVTNMAGMFNNLVNCTALDLSSFHPIALTSMAGMFYGCTVLTDINFGNNFDTSLCKQYGGCFAGCSALETVDLHSLVIPSGSTVSGMIEGNTNLKKVVAPKTIAENVTLNLPSMGKTWYQDNNNDYVADSTTTYTSLVKPVTGQPYVYIRSDIATPITEATLIKGDEFNLAVKHLTTPSLNPQKYGGIYTPSYTAEDYVESVITNIKWTTTPFDNNTDGAIVVSKDDSPIPIYAKLNGTEVELYTAANTVYFDTDSRAMFSGFTSLSKIDLLKSKINTSRVTLFDHMFGKSCWFYIGNSYTKDQTALASLEELDLSRFDTSNATSFLHMFDGCSNLQTLDVSNFNTSNCTSFYTMFRGCSGLQTLDVSNFDTSKADMFASMFNNCSGLTTLDLSGFDTSNGQNFALMFSGCSSLTSLSLSDKFTTSNATTFENMFDGCSSLVSLDLSMFTAPNVTTTTYMFRNCSSLETLNMPNTTFANVTDFSWMFDGCKKLNAIDVSHYDVSSATTVKGMFRHCESVEDLDTSSWQTGNITLFCNLFDSCENLKSVKVSRFNTSSATDMGFMFTGCKSLTSIDVSSFDTSNVTSFSNMFCHCDNVVSINGMSEWVTTNLTDMSSMFMWDSKLEDIDVSGFDVSNVRSFSYTFYGGSKIKEIDTSGWITSSANNMYCMFTGCGSITELDVSHFVTSNVGNMSHMFDGCGLVTELDVSDFDTSNVTGMSYMFMHCQSIESIDVSNFDISKVGDLYYMFNDCTSLKSLDLSSFDTSNVWRMNYIFYNCTSLEYLNISSFDTSKLSSFAIFDTNVQNLKTLVAPKTNSIAHALPTKAGTSWYLDEDNDRIADSLTTYSSLIIPVTNESHTYIRDDIDGFIREKIAYLLPGPEVNAKLKSLNTAYNLAWVTTAFDDSTNGVVVISTADSPIPVYARMNRMNSKTIELYSRAESVYLNENSEGMFSNLTSDLPTNYRPNQLMDMSRFNASQCKNFSSMFAGDFATSITGVDSWDVSAGTDFSEMFKDCSYITSLDLSGWTVLQAQNMASMFDGCYKLGNIGDISGWNTSEVTDFSRMFNNCWMIKSLDISTWDISNASDVSNIINKCKNLSVIKAPKTIGDQEFMLYSPATDMFWYLDDNEDGKPDNDMIYPELTNNINNHSHIYKRSADTRAIMMDGTAYRNKINTIVSNQILTAIRWTDEPFDDSMDGVYVVSDATSPVPVYARANGTEIEMYTAATTIYLNENASTMYEENGKLVYVDTTRFNTSYCTNMALLFYQCDKLETVDLSGWDMSHVTSLNMAFDQCLKLTDIGDVSNWDLSECTNCWSMFRYCKFIETLDLSNWKTPKLKNIDNMFYNCEKLKSLRVDNWDVTNVAVIDYFIYQNNELESIDLSNWNPSSMQQMQYSISYCPKLKSVGDISNWDVTACQLFNSPFYGCAFEELDLSGWNVQGVCVPMISGLSDLKIFKAPKTIAATNGILPPTETSMSWYLDDEKPHLIPDNDTRYSYSSGTYFKGGITDEPHTYVREDMKGALLLGGTDFNEKIKRLVDPQKYWLGTDNTITAIRYADDPFDDSMEGVIKVSDNTSAIPIYARLNNNVLELYTQASMIILNSNSMYLFSSLQALETIDTSRFETSSVTDMRAMFQNCVNLQSIDLHKFDTSSVTNMSNMFYACKALTTLDLSSFDTSNVTDMNKMFDTCQALTALDLSGFNTSNVTDMYNMFNKCNALTTLDVSSFDTSKVTDMNKMFDTCEALTTLDVSSFNTSSVTNMSNMFYQCKALTTLDVSNFDTSNVTDMNNMFAYCETLTTLDLSSFNTSNVTNMHSMFYQCQALTTLDVSSFNTSKVTDMSNMFCQCKALTTLDVSSFNTSSVTDMRYMFNNCNALTTLDVSGFDTSNVINMRSMFANCETLTTLDLSSFNTSNVTDMYNMFYQCKALTTLNLSSFNTSKVTNMNGMFYTCEALTTLNVSSFNTSNVTDMNGMFYQCKALTTLNVSSFNTSNVTNMNFMFAFCYALTTLDISNFVISDTTPVTYMCSYCSNITTLKMPQNLTHIDQKMFVGLTKLSVIYGLQEVTSIADHAFECSAYARDKDNNQIYNVLQFVDYESFVSDCWLKYDWHADKRSATQYEVVTQAMYIGDDDFEYYENEADMKNESTMFVISILQFIGIEDIQITTDEVLTLTSEDNDDGVLAFVIQDEDVDKPIAELDGTVNLAELADSCNQITKAHDKDLQRVPIDYIRDPAATTSRYIWTNEEDYIIQYLYNNTSVPKAGRYYGNIALNFELDRKVR